MSALQIEDTSEIVFPLFSTGYLVTRPVDGAKIPSFTNAGGGLGAMAAPSAAFPCANPLIGAGPYCVDTNDFRTTTCLLAEEECDNALPMDADGVLDFPYVDDHSAGGTFDINGVSWVQGDSTDFSRMNGYNASPDAASILSSSSLGQKFTWRRGGNNPQIKFRN
jgi:hypothetical protein